MNRHYQSLRFTTYLFTNNGYESPINGSYCSLWESPPTLIIPSNHDCKLQLSPLPRLYSCLAVALFGPGTATLLNLPDEPTAAWVAVRDVEHVQPLTLGKVDAEEPMEH